VPDESKNRSRGTALVFGDDTRSFLTICRSLSRAGLDVHAAPFNFRAPALTSRFIKKVHFVPYYFGEGREWKDALHRIVQEEKIDILIPCDERALIPLKDVQDELREETVVAVPTDEQYSVFFDKWKTRELAMNAGIPVASAMYLSGEKSSAEIASALGLPVAVKPTSSFEKDSLYQRRAVKLVQSEEQLTEVLGSLGNGAYFCESFFPGIGEGVSVLASKGRVLQYFQHARVHEPPKGGGSSYRISAPLHDGYKAACDKCIEYTAYTGLAMFEFRRNLSTDEWILLEVNARPWGSLPLPVSLGVDFPAWWCDLLRNDIAVTHKDYRLGHYGRNLLQDINFLRTRGENDFSSKWHKAGAYLRSAASFGRILIGKESLDSFVVDDPSPGFVEVWQLFRDKFSYLLRSTYLYRWYKKKATFQYLDQLLASPDTSVTVMVLCEGNICRSPFAAELLGKTLRNADRIVEVISRGTLPVQNRPADGTAHDAAMQMGIDLTEHRSAVIDMESLKRVDLILYFDERNLVSFRKRFPKANVTLVPCGIFNPRGKGWEIRDPYGRGLQTFLKSFREIEVSINSLASRANPKA